MSFWVWILAVVGATIVAKLIWREWRWLHAVRVVDGKLAELYKRRDELMFCERDLTAAEISEKFEVLEKIAAGEHVRDHLWGDRR